MKLSGRPQRLSVLYFGAVRAAACADHIKRRFAMATEKKPEGKMDMQAMMEVYKKVGTPGEPHQALAKMTGSWITQTKSWFEPGAPVEESTGACEQKMILDGRYLQQVYTGDMMGSPFEGINIIGYDNHTKKYLSTWIDSMSTAIYFFKGTADPDGKTITQESCYDDPVRGLMNWRSVSKIVDNDTMFYEMYLAPEGGIEEKMMEMTMTRKK
jgi:hypothetical protein